LSYAIQNRNKINGFKHFFYGMALTIDRNAGKSNRLSSHRNPARLHDYDCQHRAQLLTMAAVKFSIVTPSFRNSQWLKLCIASVADQEGVEFEHIVQDSCFGRWHAGLAAARQSGEGVHRKGWRHV